MKRRFSVEINRAAILRVPEGCKSAFVCSSHKYLAKVATLLNVSSDITFHLSTHLPVLKSLNTCGNVSCSNEMACTTNINFEGHIIFVNKLYSYYIYIDP